MSNGEESRDLPGLTDEQLRAYLFERGVEVTLPPENLNRNMSRYYSSEIDILERYLNSIDSSDAIIRQIAEERGVSPESITSVITKAITRLINPG